MTETNLSKDWINRSIKWDDIENCSKFFNELFLKVLPENCIKFSFIFDFEEGINNFRIADVKLQVSTVKFKNSLNNNVDFYDYDTIKKLYQKYNVDKYFVLMVLNSKTDPKKNVLTIYDGSLALQFLRKEKFACYFTEPNILTISKYKPESLIDLKLKTINDHVNPQY